MPPILSDVNADLVTTYNVIKVYPKKLIEELKRHAYQFVQKTTFDYVKYEKQPIYTKQKYIGKSIYDTNLYCDFVLYHPMKYKDYLIIESK